MLGNLKELLKFKELIKNLIIRELKVKYTNSALGFFWSLLNPLLIVLTFTILFTIIIKVGIKDYPLFLLCGTFPWNFFQMSLSSSCISIVNNNRLVRNSYFPTEALPLTAVISNLIHFLLSMVVLLFVLFIFKIQLSPAILFLPLLIAINLILILGLSFIVSSLYVFFRDVSFILNFLLRLFFYFVPIVYPVNFVPLRLRHFYLLNPMASLIEGYRAILLYGRLPDFSYLWISLFETCAIFIIGYTFFNKHRSLFAERA